MFDFPNLGFSEQSRTPQVDKIIPNPNHAHLIPLRSLAGGHTKAYNTATSFETNMKHNAAQYGDKISDSSFRSIRHHVVRNKPLALEEVKFSKFLTWLGSAMDRRQVLKLQYRITRGARVTRSREMNETREFLIEALIQAFMPL